MDPIIILPDPLPLSPASSEKGDAVSKPLWVTPPSTIYSPADEKRKIIASTINQDTMEIEQARKEKDIEEGVEANESAQDKALREAKSLKVNDAERIKLTAEVAEILTEILNHGQEILSPTTEFLHALEKAISTFTSEDYLKGSYDYHNFEEVIKGAFFGSNAIGAVSAGPKVVSIMCLRLVLKRQKMELEASRDALARQDVSDADKLKLKKEIQEREAKIAQMEKDLCRQEVGLGLNTTYHVTSLAKTTISYLPKEAIKKSVAIAATALKWIATGFECLIAAVAIKRGMNESHKISAWGQSFKEWKEHPVGKNDRDQVRVQALAKLQERQEQLKEKTLSMMPEHEKISLLNLADRYAKFERLKTQFNKSLDDSDPYSSKFDSQVGQILFNMGILDRTDIKQNAELIQAYTNFKEASKSDVSQLREELKNKMRAWAESGDAKRAQYDYFINMEFDRLIHQITDDKDLNPATAKQVLLDMGILNGANAEENAELIEAFARFEEILCN